MIVAELSTWLREAIRCTSRQQQGKKFEVKELFTGTEWDNLTSGEKRQLGVLYSSEYREGRIPSVRKIDNNKQHHSMYERI